jgi:tRNA(adenine34) deaminase
METAMPRERIAKTPPLLDRTHRCGQEERMSAMEIALAEAAAAAQRGEVPVGAVVVDEKGVVLARAGNRVEEKDAATHAELLALTAAARKLGQPRLAGCDLVVTLEPCPMCAAAASLFRIRRLVFGAYDPKGGGVEHGPRIFSAPTCNHRPEVIGGVREAECAALLKAFFAGLRSSPKSSL